MTSAGAAVLGCLLLAPAAFGADGESTPLSLETPKVNAPLRREAALDLIARSQESDFDVLFIGTRHSTHLDGALPGNVRWIGGDVWDVERHVKACSATAGIVLGRTTIEGWACGKPGLIYDIDLDGSIRSVDVYPPPPPDLLQQVDVEYMTTELELLYREAAVPGAGAARRTPGLGRLDALRRPPVRLELGAERTATLAFAEEVADDDSLLEAWAAACGDDPLATLVLYAEDTVVAPRVELALERACIGDETDVLLLIADRRESLAGAAERFAAVLTHRPPRRALARRPHVGAADLLPAPAVPTPV
jgi:nucleotide-binding universal stress UspA family protein